MSLIYIIVLLKYPLGYYLFLLFLLLALPVFKYLEPKVRRGAHMQSTLNKSINAKLVENYQALRLFMLTVNFMSLTEQFKIFGGA